MQIEQCMKTDVISIGPDCTVQEAAALIVEKHISTLPVVNGEGRLIGLLTIGDVLRLFMPDFVGLIEQIDFVPDFGALEDKPLPVDTARRSVREVMRQPISVVRRCGLLRAFAQINHHNLLDLPVVDERGVLVGIASRVDIGTAFLQHWLAVAGENRPDR
jgi:CBS domain-containing protein